DNYLGNEVISKKIKEYINTISCETFYLSYENKEITLCCRFGCIVSHVDEFLLLFQNRKPTETYKVFRGAIFDSSIFISNRIISHSYINTTEINEKQNVYKDTIFLEYIRLLYVLCYKRKQVDHILDFFNCFLDFEFPISTLNTESPSYLNDIFPAILVQQVKITIISNSSCKFFQIKCSLERVFNNIILLGVKMSNVMFPENTFIIKASSNNDRTTHAWYEIRDCLLVGEASMLKYLLNVQVTYFHTLKTEDIDYILGKKNGKINKVTNLCSKTNIILFPLRINYEVLTETPLSTMIVTTTDINFIHATLQSEHPELLIFNIPSYFHKRIIGYKGRNIQSLMRKHGVYVKFMTSAEASSFEGNVLVKTPFKKKHNLFLMKEEILKLSNNILYENYTFLFNFKSLKHDLNNDKNRLVLKLPETISNKYTAWLYTFFRIENNIDYIEDAKKKRELSTCLFYKLYEIDFIPSLFGLEFYTSENKEIWSIKNTLKEDRSKGLHLK
ncbi:Meiotically up-regulated 60 protein, partial [Cucumispora dikerogammari]